MLLALIPHVVEACCLDRVETGEGVFGCGHDAERQGAEGVDGSDLGEPCGLVELLRVVGREGRVGAAVDERCRGFGAVVGHGAAGRGPRRRGGVEKEQPVDLVGVGGGEGHGLGAAVGVAHDDERAGLADLVQEGVEVAGGGGEGLRCRRRVACAGAEAGVGADPGLPGQGGGDATPVVAAIVEPGDQHDGRFAGADASDVQTSIADLDELIDICGGPNHRFCCRGRWRCRCRRGRGRCRGFGHSARALRPWVAAGSRRRCCRRPC